MDSEKVPSPRISLSVEVEFRRSYSRSSANGVLKNISLSGAFLEHGDQELNKGDKVQLTFNVGDRVRKLNAVVIWKKDNGTGLKFNHNNNRDVQIIDDLMYFVENKRVSQKGVLDNILKKVG